MLQEYTREKGQRGYYDRPDLVHSLYKRVSRACCGRLLSMSLLSCVMFPAKSHAMSWADVVEADHDTGSC